MWPTTTTPWTSPTKVGPDPAVRRGDRRPEHDARNARTDARCTGNHATTITVADHITSAYGKGHTVQHTLHQPRRVTASASVPQAARVIGAAVAVALAVWTVVQLLGVDPVVGRGGDLTSVTTVNVVVSTVLAGTAAWFVHALLRRTGRAQWWPFVGSTALAISVIGPSWLADGASGIALICMHVAVAAVLIAGFHRIPWETRSTRPV